MSNDSPFVITKEAIRAQWEALREAERLVREQRDQFELTAAFMRAQGRGDWIPVEPDAPVERRMGKKPQKSGTWTSEILSCLREAPDGLTYAQIKEHLSKGSMAAKLEGNPNGYYNAAALLTKQGEVFKHGTRLVAKHHHAAFLEKVEKGEIAESDDERTGTVLHRLTTFVNAHPEGVSAAQIVAAMEEQGMTSGSVYNNLAKAAHKKRISRQGKLYVPYLNENGVPSGTPSTGE